MLTGESYTQVRSVIDGFEATGHDGDWDAHGISHVVLERFLAARGFYMQHDYMGWHCRRVDDARDPADPVRWQLRDSASWPPGPWAPAHFAQVTQPSGRQHYVAMDWKGWVLDPMHKGFFSLRMWPAVSYVVGVIRPAQHNHRDG